MFFLLYTILQKKSINILIFIAENGIIYKILGHYALLNIFRRLLWRQTVKITKIISRQLIKKLRRKSLRPRRRPRNRQRIKLKTVYKALKMASEYQYLMVTGYKEENNNWKWNQITENWIAPQ